MDQIDEVEEPDGDFENPPKRSGAVRAHDTMTLSAPPIHPVACMQGPFDESMAESTQGPDDSAKSVKETEDPKLRRQKVLEDEEYSSSYNAQWRHNPKSKYHPLWKIIAQICFGIHLMHQRLAKSDDEVLKILQLHVDEIDTFLRTTTQDFDLAMEDIKERLSYLKLPLEHVNIFDTMLDDRQFRASIVDGNEKIERIIERTARAMNDSLVDVEKGIEATTELSAYLENIRGGFAEGQEEWTSIYTAMRGNAEGWYRCFRSLQVKGNSLGVALVQLGSIVNEMSKRAGVASRRSIIAQRIDSDSRSSSRVALVPPAPRRPQHQIPDKPLPKDPDLVSPAVQATLHNQEKTIYEKRYENPRKQPLRPAERPAQSASDASAGPEEAKDKTLAHGPSTTEQHHSDRPQKTFGMSQPVLRKGHSASKSESNLLAVSHSKRSNRPPVRDRTMSPIAPDSAYSSGDSDSDLHNIASSPRPSRRQSKPGLSSPAGGPVTPSALSTKSSWLSKANTYSSPSPELRRRKHSFAGKPEEKGSGLSFFKRLFTRKAKSRRNGSFLGCMDEANESA